MKLIVYTDGGARGNPGSAAIGVVIYNEKGKVVSTISRYLGRATNNQAEYQAIHAALEACRELHANEVKCFLDAELVVKQLNGEYRVRDAGLSVWFSKIETLRNQFSKITFHHVPREKNTFADRLVNEALDHHVHR